MKTTRLAPSPTGALHLGNARTFLVNWLLARQQQWHIILRVEDLDGPRIKAGSDQQAIADLRWLGLDWDEGPVYQSARMASYDRAVEALVTSGVAYPCACSRKEIKAAASAPHAEDGATIYPGTCRGRYRSIEDARQQSGREPALRFAVPAGDESLITFEDQFSGIRRFDVARDLGDFVIAKALERDRGRKPDDAFRTPAYQLAVVVDDAEMGVTNIVRGDDLIDSTPRQILSYRALGIAERLPRYCHVPLVVGADGQRLAKRHGDTRLSYYREQGVAPGRVLALLARWCGVASEVRPHKASDLLGAFRLQDLPVGPVTFSSEDDAWLRAG